MEELSIIICSRKKYIDKDLLENIENTVGCGYELIVVDNSENEYSIFEAYNKGIERSNNDYLCFIHEDVIFQTSDWGKFVLNYFIEFKHLGILGVAGSRIKTQIPSGWWENKPEHLVLNLVQTRPDGTLDRINRGFREEGIEKVVVVDGFFMAVRKDPNIRFNEKLLGFHNYDQSVCLDYINHGYNVYVTNKILIEHASNGIIDDNWVKSSIKFHEIYNQYLPQTIPKVAIKRKDKSFNCYKFFFHCINTSNNKLAFIYFIKHFKLAPFIKENKILISILIKKILK